MELPFGQPSFNIFRTTGILYALKYSLPQHILKIIYNTLILSKLHYGVLVWGQKIHTLETLQKKAIRHIAGPGVGFNAHTAPLFKNLKLLKVCDIYKLQLVKLFFKIKNNIAPHYFINLNIPQNRDIHHHDTRQSSQLHVQLVRHSFTNSTITNKLIGIINSMSNEIQEKIYIMNMYSFATFVKRLFIESYVIECQVQNCFICQHRDRGNLNI